MQAVGGHVQFNQPRTATKRLVDALHTALGAYLTGQTTGFETGRHLVQAGWAAFPLPQGRKSDSGPGGLSYADATLDPTEWDRLAADVKARHACPDVGVAIVPARCAVPLAAVDLDGPEQVEKLDAACAEHDTDRTNWVAVHTAGRLGQQPHGPGLHLYLTDTPTAARSPFGDVRADTGHLAVCVEALGDRQHYHPTGRWFASAKQHPWLLERGRGAARAAGDPLPFQPEPVDLDGLPEPVRRLLGEIVPQGERSERFHSLIATCRRCGLSLGQTFTVCAEWDRHHHKYGPRLAVEVARSWAKLDDADPSGITLGIRADEPDPLTELWHTRQNLALLRDHARAQRVAPAAVLGATLTRAVAAIPAAVVIPPLRAGPSSLNLYLALVAISGGGKDGANDCAAAALPTANGFHVGGLGSGEGLMHAYVHRTRNGVEQHTAAVLMEVSEVDMWAALDARRGSTLNAQLRAAWTGRRLAFAYADPTKRLHIAAHTYRLCVIAGVQPGRAGPLLDNAAGGLPQRILWLPAVDAHPPRHRPNRPEPLTWKLPALPPAHPRTGLREIRVCEQARNEIDAAAVAEVQGKAVELDGHSLLNRLKVAVALAVVDGRLEIRDDDWRLAGIVMRLSDRTRDSVVAHLAAEKTRTAQARAEIDANRAVTVADRLDRRTARRVADRLEQVLAAHPEGLPGAKLRKRVAARDRGHFDEAIADLLGRGRVETVQIDRRTGTGHGGSGLLYRLKKGAAQ